MRRNFIALIVFISIICAFPVQEAAAASDPVGTHPVALKVGEDFDLSQSDTIVGPATAPICDDPKVVMLVDLPSGVLGFRGMAPGSTLCSAASAVGPRRVYRITVKTPEP